MSVQSQFSSYSEYVRLTYQSGYVVENCIVGSDNIGLIKMTQGDVHFSDPAMPDLVLTSKTCGYARGVLDCGNGRFDLTELKPFFCITAPEASSEVLTEGRYEIASVAIPGAYALAMLGNRIGNSLDFGKLHSAVHTDKKVLGLLGYLHDQTTLDSNNALLVDGLVMALLGQLADFAQIMTKPRAIRALDEVLLREIENLFQDDLRGNPTMQDLAKLSGMSVDHFAKCFRRATGQTPYQYVLSKRIERAKALLEHSKLPLIEVALTVGFSSQSHMNKLFQQKLGFSPGSYRQS